MRANRPKAKLVIMRDEPFTPIDIERACDDLGMLEFFPRESRLAAMAFLRTICPHRRALKWLVAELMNHVGKWPGPAEVRGLLCTRFDAADGIDQWCSLPGYTAEEQEAKHLERHKQLTQAEGYVGEESRDMVRQLKRALKALPKAHRTS
jgi:hypothetical protein